MYPPIPTFQPPQLSPPICHPPPSPSFICPVILFENERYSPIFGWSVKGLLPTDRKAISNSLGDCSWNSFEEVEKCFLSYGWRWQEDNSGEVKLNDWQYAVDFIGFNETTSGSVNKRISHFVRRRSYCRNLVFHVDFLTNGEHVLTCDHCDLKEVNQLSSALLDNFVTLSLLLYPGKFSIDKVAKVKNLLLDSFGATPGHSINPHHQYSYDETILAMKALCDRTPQQFILFQRKERKLKRSFVVKELFCEKERQQLAQYLIRKTDHNHLYHCAQQHCGPQCVFAVYGCANVGCREKYSLKWQAAHDETCPFKIVACSNMCGEGMKRKDLQCHLTSNCILRKVKCTYYDMGCTKRLVCRDLPQHCLDCVSKHLKLTKDTLVRLKARSKAQDGEILVLQREEADSRSKYNSRHSADPTIGSMDFGDCGHHCHFDCGGCDF